MTLAQVNALDRERFVAALGEVFEHSPWIAEVAWSLRPFASIDALHIAMVGAMRSASAADQLALLRAHPELAGKAAIRGELTADSKIEQSGAGLDRCSPAEYARLQELNGAYNKKFGFPFIIAVKGLDRAAIIARFTERIERDRPREFDEALGQIGAIARFRLEALIDDRPPGSRP
jgi:2-oxo-4-hydroxy-4-carboxy-5-ureidoimidazoline decarboxylase